jgi:hypothetical protein
MASGDLRLPDRHAALACLTETYLFARDGIREHSVGPASAELAGELGPAEQAGLYRAAPDIPASNHPAAPPGPLRVTSICAALVLGEQRRQVTAAHVFRVGRARAGGWVVGHDILDVASEPGRRRAPPSLPAAQRVEAAVGDAMLALAPVQVRDIVAAFTTHQPILNGLLWAPPAPGQPLIGRIKSRPEAASASGISDRGGVRV